MIGLMWFLGCGDKQADTSQGEDSMSCEGLEEEQCLNSECSAIYGFELAQEAEQYCLDESIYMEEKSYAGCTMYQSDLTVEVAAGPADGSACWLFPSGSMPQGWLECEELQLAVGSCQGE